ncbi:hypothetical protein SNEBB_005254 [Seison nebaliae]|nr:hypothetical protein SNEBB_005254 [Seison nebaliae]
MNTIILSIFLCIIVAFDCAKEITQLQIGIKKRIAEADCKEKSKNGDSLQINYEGKLLDGTLFDSNLDKENSFKFILGSGQVIKGWEYGLIGMCVGEKRRLKIPSSMAYGENGSGEKIPPNASLIFDVELLGIKQHGQEESEMEEEPDEL